MNTKLKTKVQVKLSASSESHSRTLLKTRDLIDVADEPEVRGGTNEGFAPTEMALASLMACSNVISHKIAHKHGIEVVDMDFEMEATFNRLGVTLQEEVDVPFPEIKMTISITTPASDKELQTLKDELPRFCPVDKLFTGAGTKVNTNWVVIRPQLALLILGPCYFLTGV